MNWFTSSPAPSNPATERPEATDMEPITPCTLNCFGKTDIGRKRRINQDHFLIADLHKNMHVCQSSVHFKHPELFGDTMGKLLFVADGVGGSRAGDIASQLAIQEMAEHLLNSMHWLFCPTQSEIEQFAEDLKSGAWRSHATVREDSQNNPEHRGMGTTLTVAYIFWPMLYVLHVGDSRCYILRDKSIERLTKDQTLAQVLLDSGQLSKYEFDDCPYHNVLVSSIGGDSGPEALVYKTRLAAGDRILLCSDGLNGHLTDDDIESILSGGLSPSQACVDLIDTANERGGSDNITAVVAYCDPT